MKENYKQFFIKLRVSAPSGDFWMLRPFETETIEQAQEEGKGLANELNFCVDEHVQFEYDSVLTKAEIKKY